MIDNSALREGSPDSETAVARTVIVVNQLGLHARPAAQLAQEAQNFQSEITILCDSQEVDAKSILDILTLAAAQGSSLELKAEGVDAVEALDCLEGLFKSKFGEDK